MLIGDVSVSERKKQELAAGYPSKGITGPPLKRTLYLQNRQPDLAGMHMEEGIRILDQYHLAGMHDSLPQTANYATLLCDAGDPEHELEVLQKLAVAVGKYKSDTFGDYAEIQETMGSMCLIMGRVKEATEHLRAAMGIYETLWQEDPERIQAKYDQIEQMYAAAGIGLAQRYLMRESDRN